MNQELESLLFQRQWRSILISILILILTLLACQRFESENEISAPDKLTVVLAPLRNVSGRNAGDTVIQKVDSAFTNILRSNSRVQSPRPEEVKAIIDAERISQNDLMQEQTAKTLAKQLGAQYVVQGSCDILQERVYLLLQFYDAEEQRAIEWIDENDESSIALLNKIAPIFKEIVDTLILHQLLLIAAQPSPALSATETDSAQMTVITAVTDTNRFIGEEGTLAGLKQMSRYYLSIIEKDSTDINAHCEVAYALVRTASILHINKQYNLLRWIKDDSDKSKAIDSLFTRAKHYLQRAQNINAGHARVLAVESILQRKLGNNPKAVKLAKQAFDADSTDVRVLEAYELTRIKSAEIIALYRRLVDLVPDNPYYWWQLGNFASKSKDKKAFYQKALNLNPAYTRSEISLILMQWKFSPKRIKALGEIAKSDSEVKFLAKYHILKGFLDAIWWIIIILVILFNFFSRLQQSWKWIIPLYLVAQLCFMFIPGIGNRVIFLTSLKQSLSFLLYIAFLISIWNLIKIWMLRDSDDRVWVAVNKFTRGMLAPFRKLLGVSVDSNRMEFSYYLFFIELLVLNAFIQQVFIRLMRLW